MIKIIFICFGTFFFLIVTIVIFYWRDIQYIPNHSDLIFSFLLLPLGASLLVLLPYFVYKVVLLKRKNKIKPSMDKEQQTITGQSQQGNTDLNTASSVETISLKVYSSHILHALGQDECLIQALHNIQAPSLDLDLSARLDTTILSYRIAEIDDQLRNTINSDKQSEQLFTDNLTAQLNMRLLRLQCLIQHLLLQHLDEIIIIIDHIQKSKRFYHSSQNPAYHSQNNANQHCSYKIERGWELNETERQDNEATDKLEYIAPLESMNIHLILPDNLCDKFDENQFQYEIKQYLCANGIESQHIKYQIHFMSPKEHLDQWSNLLKQLSLDQAQCALCIAVDSDIDMEDLSDVEYFEHQCVAAEFAVSLCISATEQYIKDINEYRNLNFSIGESSISKMIERFGVDVKQFSKELPCIIISEKVGKRKTIQLVQQIMTSTLVESDHLLYALQALGDSQNLAKLFNFVLMTQFDQSVYGLFLSAQPSGVQAVITPLEYRSNSVTT